MCPYYMLEHLLGICPGEVLLDLPVVLCPILWGTARLISRVVVPAYNPTSNGGVFLFLHILNSICCHLNYWSLPFWLVWGGISGLFWFAFPWWLRMLNFSLGASWPFNIPQLKILCLALYPIFNRVIWFSGVLTSWVLCIYWILALDQMWDWWRSFPICWWLFCLLESIFCLTEGLQFYEVPFVDCWS